MAPTTRRLAVAVAYPGPQRCCRWAAVRTTTADATVVSPRSPSASRPWWAGGPRRLESIVGVLAATAAAGWSAFGVNMATCPSARAESGRSLPQRFPACALAVQIVRDLAWSRLPDMPGRRCQDGRQSSTSNSSSSSRSTYRACHALSLHAATGSSAAAAQHAYSWPGLSHSVRLLPGSASCPPSGREASVKLAACSLQSAGARHATPRQALSPPPLVPPVSQQRMRSACHLSRALWKACVVSDMVAHAHASLLLSRSSVRPPHLPGTPGQQHHKYSACGFVPLRPRRRQPSPKRARVRHLRPAKLLATVEPLYQHTAS